MTTPAILTRNLTKFYGPHRGIEAVNLEVHQGEVFGFLGPNGAGKTTTIRLLLDLLRPTRGSAKILGLDCRSDSLEVRRRIGYVPSEYRLYENLTGRRMIGFIGGLGARVNWLYTTELAERLGLDLDRGIRTLSHGNKQKLAIILAFMHKAPIVILDEPTTGLDPLVQQEFFGLIAETRAAGRTVFLSSHNLTEVERVCDRVAGIRDGRLIAVDEIAAIRGSALRLVEITCARPPTRDAFAAIENLSDLRIDGSVLRCSVHGALGELLAAAVPFSIIDVLSREPNLEEFFLAMYPEGTTRNAG